MGAFLIGNCEMLFKRNELRAYKQKTGFDRRSELTPPFVYMPEVLVAGNEVRNYL